METTAVRARMEGHVSHPDWPLDPDITFLNHGSYGVCPRPVLEAQSRYRAQMERDPVAWFVRDMQPLLDRARDSHAGLVGCRPEHIGWTTNATVAIATVLYAMDWREGDEILACDQEYMSAINEIRRLEARRGVRLVCPPIGIPARSDEDIIAQIMERVTDRTRLAILSHITSPSAMVLPVDRLTRLLRERGIDVIVDGAHAPGQIDVNIEAIDPTYYVATLHKWVCAPKGSGFLWVHPDRHALIRPIALSSRAHNEHPTRPRFLRDFDYHGTDDYSAVIAVADAIEYLGGLLPGGWGRLREANRSLVLAARAMLCDRLDLTPPAPESMIAMMATVLLPPRPESLADEPSVFDDPIQDRLVNDHRIQVPIWTNPMTGRRFCRISAQVYNRLDEYERLADALAIELERERAEAR